MGKRTSVSDEVITAESATPATDEGGSSSAWSGFTVVAALLAATVTRKGLDAFWRAATGKQPPSDPADPEVSLREAMLWAILSGTAVAVVKMIATRRTAGYYAKSTGRPAPGTKVAPRAVDPQ